MRQLREKQAKDKVCPFDFNIATTPKWCPFARRLLRLGVYNPDCNECGLFPVYVMKNLLRDIPNKKGAN